MMQLVAQRIWDSGLGLGEFTGISQKILVVGERDMQEIQSTLS
ncbi:hypothetical protein [Paenibacillus odorifer]|nr:hypothetical protein [Paenibacillus odorifer]